MARLERRVGAAQFVHDGGGRLRPVRQRRSEVACVDGLRLTERGADGDNHALRAPHGPRGRRNRMATPTAYINGEFAPLADAKGRHPDARAALRHGRVRGHPRQLERRARDNVHLQTAGALRAAPAGLQDALDRRPPHGGRTLRHHRGTGGALRLPRGLVHPPGGVQGAGDGGEPQPPRAGRRLLLPRRAVRQLHRLRRRDLVLRRVLPAHRRHDGAPPLQAERLVPELHPRQDRRRRVGLRGGDYAEYGRPRVRGHRGEHLRRA